jgi:hypothetical protein
MRYHVASVSRLLAAAVFTAGLAASASGQASNRLFLIGNSVTDCIDYGGFETLVAQSGNTLFWARNVILGSPLALLWTDTGGGFTTAPYGAHQHAFVNYTWDCVSLQPFDRPITGADGDSLMICNFINEAKPVSPNAQFYIYERWPRDPLGDNNPAANASCTANLWNQLWLGTYGLNQQPNEVGRWFDSLLVQVRKANLGMKQVLMVPVGSVMSMLNQKMAAGQVPGYTSIWGVYSDGIHLSGTGHYIVACTYFATLYKQDPRGLSVPASFGTIPDAVRDSIQSAVYQIVFTHPYSGATLADLVPATGVTVTPATLPLGMLQSGSVSATVAPGNAANKRVTWLCDNTGVAIVDAAGNVTGVGTGTANVIARTNSGGFKDTCVVTVSGSLPGNTQHGLLAAWDFQGITGQDSVKATTIMAGVDSVKPDCRALVGPGLGMSAYVGNGLFGGDGTSVTLTQAIAGNEYFSFRVGPQAGKLVSIDTVELNVCSQNSTRTFSLYSSVRGFAQDMLIDSFPGGWSTFRRVIPSGLTNQPGVVEFRLYVHGVNNVYESMGLANAAGNEIAVRGSIFTPSDATPPSAPPNLIAPFAQVRDTSVFLAWDAATDNLVVWGYNIYLGAAKLNSSLLKGLNFTAGGLTSGNSYTFTVKAVDFVGNESTIGTSVTVRTNRQPTAAFTATPSSGNAPLQVTFAPTGSVDPDSGDYILGYVWDFGDGSGLNYSNAPVHTYQAQGSFTASLKVVDSRDFYSTTVTRSISVGATGVRVSAMVQPALRPVALSVFDMMGRLVWRGMRPAGFDRSALVAQLGGGTYVLRIRDAGVVRQETIGSAVR